MLVFLTNQRNPKTPKPQNPMIKYSDLDYFWINGTWNVSTNINALEFAQSGAQIRYWEAEDPDKDPQMTRNEPEHIGRFVRLIVKTLKSRDAQKFKEWVEKRPQDWQNAKNLLFDLLLSSKHDLITRWDWYKRRALFDLIIKILRQMRIATLVGLAAILESGAAVQLS